MDRKTVHQFSHKTFTAKAQQVLDWAAPSCLKNSGCNTFDSCQNNNGGKFHNGSNKRKADKWSGGNMPWTVITFCVRKEAKKIYPSGIESTGIQCVLLRWFSVRSSFINVGRDYLITYRSAWQRVWGSKVIIRGRLSPTRYLSSELVKITYVGLYKFILCLWFTNVELSVCNHL